MKENPVENSDRFRKLAELRRACGPIILEALEDSDVVEIIINPDGSLWIESHSAGMRMVEPNFPTDAVEAIVTLSGQLQRSPIPVGEPIVEGEFPLDGSRLAGVLPPLATAPMLALRKHSPSVFTLDQYKKSGIFKRVGSPVQRSAPEAMRSFEHPIDAIREAVGARKNVLIVGGTGSGKTTLTNAILREISDQCPRDRIVALEDTVELQVSARNHALLRTSKDADLRRLLRVTMRLRPDRIVVGEVRGGEAYTLLKSWNSGHAGGLATMHANSSEEGLQKLAHYIYEDPAAQSFTPEAIGWMIASAVNLIVVIERCASEPGRIVTEICEVTGYMNERYSLNTLRLQIATGRSEFKLRV